MRPICFTRILLGGEMGPWDEDFVSGSVTDADGVRDTELFDRLTLEYPEVENWPAICTVYHGGGPSVIAASMPADELDLKIMREEGTRFLDRPGICLAGHRELRVPAQEQELEMDEGSAPWEFQMVRVAIQNFLKNPVISMVFGLSDNTFSCFDFTKYLSFGATVK